MRGKAVDEDAGCVADAAERVLCEPNGTSTQIAWCIVRLSDGKYFTTGAPVNGCGVVRNCTDVEHDRIQPLEHTVCP